MQRLRRSPSPPGALPPSATSVHSQPPSRTWVNICQKFHQSWFPFLHKDVAGLMKELSHLENQGQGRMHLEIKSLSLEGQRYEVKVTLRAEGMLQGGTEPPVHTLLQVKDQRGVATRLGHRANPGPGWGPRQHDSLGLSFLATPRDSEFSILSFSFFLLFFFCNILPPPPPSFCFCNCSLSSSPVALPGPRMAF